MNIFVTASNEAYRDARLYNVKKAKQIGGFDKVVSYDIDSMIDYGFRNTNKCILDQKRGAGLWLWKPYFVFKALMEECEEGDMLFYLDAASFFFRSIKHQLDSIEEDVIVSQLPYIEKEYTKNEVFVSLGLDESKYKDTPQFHASYVGFRKSKTGVEICKKWLDRCTDLSLIGDDCNLSEQCENFQEHRFDQSLLSLTCKEHAVKPTLDFTIKSYLKDYRSFVGQTVLDIPQNSFSKVCIVHHHMPTINYYKIIRQHIAMFKDYLIRR